MLARRTNLLPGTTIPALRAYLPIPRKTYRDGKWFRMSQDEREAYLRKVWPTARTIEEAADAVECSMGCLSLAAARLGLPVRGMGRKRRAQ
jgi:hypothetical protein